MHFSKSSVLKLKTGEQFKIVTSENSLFYYSSHSKSLTSWTSMEQIPIKLLEQKVGQLYLKDVGNTLNIKTEENNESCATCALGKISKKPAPTLCENKATQNLKDFSLMYLNLELPLVVMVVDMLFPSLMNLAATLLSSTWSTNLRYSNVSKSI